MPVEFLGIGATNDGTETHARSGAAFDPAYTVALARAHEETGWDRVLTAYGSGSADPAQAAALIACRTERLQLLLAHRPNVSYPTFAAKTLASLDQLSGGRATLHVITGGNDHEQQREGDILPKDQRYGRTREAIQIYKKAWTSKERFDFHGQHYDFTDFALDARPVQQPRPRISFGGSSPAAYKVGAEEADIYALWGEPLAGTAEQIATITQLAKEAGRPAPAFQVAFRPILGRTEEEAWEKAHATVATIRDRTRGDTPLTYRHPLKDPENAGSQRLLAVAEQGERHDRALWTVTAEATGGAGNSTALVGTPETVAAALMDYYDLGVRILSARGYDLLADAREFGTEVIPLVRAEGREARRGRLIDPRIKENAMPLVNFAVSGTGTGVAQTVAVKGADYVIQTDAYPAFGGQDAHPSPLAYTLASLSSCNQVTSQIVAKELGITIDAVQFDVAADFDPTTMTTGRDSPDATFQDLRITAEITTAATADQFEQLRDEVARRCPVSVLFARAGVKITNDWTQLKPS